MAGAEMRTIKYLLFTTEITHRNNQSSTTHSEQQYCTFPSPDWPACDCLQTVSQAGRQRCRQVCPHGHMRAISHNSLINMDTEMGIEIYKCICQRCTCIYPGTQSLAPLKSPTTSGAYAFVLLM